MPRKKRTDSQSGDGQDGSGAPSPKGPNPNEHRGALISLVERILAIPHTGKQNDEVTKALLLVLHELATAENDRVKAETDLLRAQSRHLDAETQRVSALADAEVEAAKARVPSVKHCRDLEDQVIIDRIWDRRLRITCVVLLGLGLVSFSIAIAAAQFDPTTDPAVYIKLKSLGGGGVLGSLALAVATGIYKLAKKWFEKSGKGSVPILTPPSPARS